MNFQGNFLNLSWHSILNIKVLAVFWVFHESGCFIKFSREYISIEIFTFLNLPFARGFLWFSKEHQNNFHITFEIIKYNFELPRILFWHISLRLFKLIEDIYDFLNENGQNLFFKYFHILFSLSVSFDIEFSHASWRQFLRMLENVNWVNF